MIPLLENHSKGIIRDSFVQRCLVRHYLYREKGKKSKLGNDDIMEQLCNGILCN